MNKKIKPSAAPFKKERKTIKESNKILRDAKIVMDAKIESKMNKKKTHQLLSEKYGEEKAKDLVDQYFNFMDQ